MAAPDRLPPIPPSAYTPDQEAAAADFRRLRGVEPFGPYAPLMRSPKVMIDVEALGRRLRYGSCLSEDLKEMAICQVARSYSQQFEWSVHAMEAEKAGVSKDILAALADGARHGEQGAVEIPTLVGIYSLLALVLNVARTPSDGPEGLARWPE